MHLRSILLVCSIHLSYEQSCSMAPTLDLAIFCEQLQGWDTATRQELSRPLHHRRRINPPGFPPDFGNQIPLEQTNFNTNEVQLPIPRSPYSCMELSCLCLFFNGRMGPDGACFLNNGKRLGPAVRKEYRRMTDDERNRFHAAMNRLKQSGEYDNFSRIHAQKSDSGGAHSGPAFLPWHREFTKRIEIGLRMIDPEVPMPYWDSVLDQSLPDPRDSVIWSPLFFGESDSAGNVINGPFANWRTLEGRNTIRRRLGRQGSLFTENQLNTFLQKRNIESVLAYSTPGTGCRFPRDFAALEYVHGNVHFWVGGEMLDQSTSANDPAFYLHHSFVDQLWEQWRQNRQNRWERENVYPQDIGACSNDQHFRFADMRPFDGFRNVDGLSNRYTDEMYVYEPRPTCSNALNCESEYLFCDRSHGWPKCVSKVKIGGRCDGFEQEDICFGGICRNGRCFQGRTRTTAVARRTTTTTMIPPPKTRTNRPSPVIFNNCFNEHPCCAHWATEGECSSNPDFMEKQCQASCNQCRPSFDISTECSDHHESCQFWERRGECKKNAYWMEENCRKSCGLCDRSKTERCQRREEKKTGRPQIAAVTISTVTLNKLAQSTAQCEVMECYNENKCCDEWKRQGECSRNAGWMRCNCKVSCGVCQPNFDFGSCTDYHQKCRPWMESGECSKNPWMLENCRTSCATCMTFSKDELRRQCNANA